MRSTCFSLLQLLIYNDGDFTSNDNLRRLGTFLKLTRHSINLRYFKLNLSYRYNLKKEILDKAWDILNEKWWLEEIQDLKYLTVEELYFYTRIFIIIL